ncbi:MAG: TlpA family protein disulfide reductase [Gammaproteobacteria bacterium]|nr:TlpA family protein disulfide reductase [Gammaproteobacteria bacterium]
MIVRNSFFALCVAFLVSACGEEVAEAKAAEGAQQGAVLSLQGIDGKLHQLSDYRGKWVVVNYWATWCPPCLEEIPELVDFHERHKNTDAVVLGVNYEDKAVAELTDFSDEYLISYPILLGEPGSGKNIGPIPGLPTTYVISPTGEIVARQVGPLTAQMLEDFIAEQQKLTSN